MTLSDTTEYRVSAKGFNAVKRICSKITNQESRRRAFKALLCMDTLADYLYSQGFDIDISKNLYKILPLNEEFEFTDIHCNGRFINVVPVVNGQYVLIPKNHTIFDVVPELYVVADYNQTTKKVKFLGCFEGDKIPKNVENGSYYVCNINNIQPPAMVDELLSSVKQEELSEISHGLFVSFFIDYLDGVLDDTSKKRLITHLIECKECRSELVEFFDYEMIAKETKNFPGVLADNTLDIVGAVAVNDPKYKDFKEYTIKIEKQKDEYEEDEEENIGGKQIKSAIEDPLQILYGKNKNKQIFELMGDRPKKQSILDSVMSDISKSAQKEVKQELSQEEMNVSYEGVINPEYYAEGLPEGTDTEQNSGDLKLDIDSITNLNKEDDDIFEIVEEDNDAEILNFEEQNEEETKSLSDTKIPKSLKSDLDEPDFSSRLKDSEETKVSAQDEMILLDEEKSVDEPEFVSLMKSTPDAISDEKSEYDNLITLEDDDDLSFLEPQKNEDDLPNSMDGVVFYDEEENTNGASENSEDDDFLTIPQEENKASDTSISDFDLKDDFSETIILKDNIINETEKDNSDEIIILDENFGTDNVPQNIENTKTLQVAGNIEDEGDELTEDELIHFDAVDIDIVNEDEIQYFESPSIVPSTIENAGIAASSLIDDYEDDTKETIALNAKKQISSNEEKNLVNDFLNDVSSVAADKYSERGINDLLANSEDVDFNFGNNTDSVNNSEDEIIILDEEDDLRIIDDNAENDDFILIDEDEDSQKSFAIPTKVNDDEFSTLEKDEEDDLLIIDDNDDNDENDENDDLIIDKDIQKQEKQDFENNTNSVSSSAEENLTEEDSDDDFLNSLPMINKEDIKQEELRQPSSNQVDLGDDESSLLSFDDDNSDLLSFGDDQDFLLSEESEPFVLEETSKNNDVQETQDSELLSKSSQVQEQEDELVMIDENISSFGNEQTGISAKENTDEEEDEIVMIDDDLSSFDDKKSTTPITGSMTDDEDDDEIVIIDDEGTAINPISDKQDVKTEKVSDFEPVSDDLGFDDTVDFFRPAGASFDYNNEDFDNNFVSAKEEKIDIIDDIEPVSVSEEKDDEQVDIEPVAETENKSESEEVEFIQDDETEQEEETAQEGETQKPVSQLDLIFKSLSSREKEQIDAIQKGIAVKEEIKELPPKKTELLSETPKTTTMFKKNFKDAITAKDEAVEEGRISLKPSDEPIVDTLINTAVQTYDEDDYEEVFEEEEQETAEIDEADVTEEVEYVYEDENGNEYIPEDGEEVEYVYEDENGNVISEEEVQQNEVREDIQENTEETEEYQEDSEYEEEDISSEEVNFDEETSFVEEEVEQAELDEEELQSSEETEETEKTEDTEETEEIEDEELNSQDDAKKKSIIKKSIIAAAVALVLIGGGITTKVILSHSNANAGQEALNAGVATDETANLEEGGLSVPEGTNAVTEGEPVIGGEEEGGLSIPESDADLSAAETQATQELSPTAEPSIVEPQVPTTPKAGTSNATTSDMNKAVANAFSETPSSMTVRKASWGVGATLAADTEFKAYLQRMGKAVKADLKKSLAAVRGEAPANPVKIQIKMSDTGVLQDVIILKSSGNSQVDEIVLQSVKQTAAACPFPKLSENTLNANNQATGGNTVKMSLTVTF